MPVLGAGLFKMRWMPLKQDNYESAVSRSQRVKFEGVVGELLAEEPPAEVEDHFARDRRMPHVQVPLLLFLEHLSEHAVHHHRHVCRAVNLAELVALLDLVETVPEVDYEILDEALGVAADVRLDFQQEFAKYLIDHCAVSVIELQLLLFLMLLPVLLYAFHVVLIFSAQFLDLLFAFLVLVGKWEQLVQIPPQIVHVLGVGFGLLCGLLLLDLIFYF